jgi:hypothetical protein
MPTHHEIEEMFFLRLLDMHTAPATAALFDDDDRRRVEKRHKMLRTQLYLGAFHAACDDLGVPREERSQIENLFFGER